MTSTAAETEALILAAFARAFESLGFSLSEGPDWETADASWWFARRSGGVSEMIWCRLRWRPTGVMTVQLVASTYTLATLRKRGLEGRAAAHNLFNFQVHFMDAGPSSILPQVIPLKRASDPEWATHANELAGRIAAEIRRVEPVVWSDLHTAV